MELYLATINASRSQLPILDWLRNHLLTCPFKYITGLDCPGCGFQRSVLALIQGDVSNSFYLYPPTIPLLLFFIYGIASRFYQLDNQREQVKKGLFILVGTIVLISYCIKLWHIYHYASSSAAVAAII